jgi:hypothetical protein
MLQGPEAMGGIPCIDRLVASRHGARNIFAVELNAVCEPPGPAAADIDDGSQRRNLKLGPVDRDILEHHPDWVDKCAPRASRRKVEHRRVAVDHDVLGGVYLQVRFQPLTSGWEFVDAAAREPDRLVWSSPGDGAGEIDGWILAGTS